MILLRSVGVEIIELRSIDCPPPFVENCLKTDSVLLFKTQIFPSLSKVDLNALA